MSRYGRRSSWKPAWKCKPIGGSGASVRDELADIDLAAKKWAAIAPVLGFCSSCGALVNEAEGKLHDEGCIPSAPERCRVGQRS